MKPLRPDRNYRFAERARGVLTVHESRQPPSTQLKHAKVYESLEVFELSAGDDNDP
jgi:hypothetical protein